MLGWLLGLFSFLSDPAVRDVLRNLLTVIRPAHAAVAGTLDPQYGAGRARIEIEHAAYVERPTPAVERRLRSSSSCRSWLGQLNPALFGRPAGADLSAKGNHAIAEQRRIGRAGGISAEDALSPVPHTPR